MKHYTITFVDSHKAPLCLTKGVVLSEQLDAINSPILFGCRSGICGTCLCEVEVDNGGLSKPSDDEQEALALYAPDNPKARLACQLTVEADISLKKIECYEES